MRQLNLKGEIDWPVSQPVGHIDFSVNRPNGSAQVRVDLNAKKAYVKEFANGHLHTFQVFHTFSGTRFNQPATRRDWIVTSLWVWAMDALAAGLIVMVFGQLLHVVAFETEAEPWLPRPWRLVSRPAGFLSQDCSDAP